MAILRRNAGLVSTLGGLMLMVVVIWWAFVPSTATKATLTAVAYFQEIPAPLTRLAAARIQTLRVDSGIDDDALACLNLNDSQLDTVLTAVRSWYESNTSLIQAKQTAISDKQALVRSLKSQHDVGPADQGIDDQLNTAVADLATAQSEYETVLASARTSILASLSQQQRGLVDRMRGNHEVAMPYRYLDLNAAQKTAVLRACSRHFRAQSSAQDSDAAVQGALQEQFGTDVTAAIGETNVSSLASLAGFRGAASRRVVDAIARNLPVVPEGNPG